jgi:S-adenosylmethionine synthetase
MIIPKNYTAESVTSGHPDKVCDQISDAILDQCLKQDPQSRVAIEVLGSHNFLVIGGEVTTKARVDYQKIAQEVYQGIGYQDKLRIEVNVLEQSADISLGVDTGGAGDQGIMYGFATDETPELMPKASITAHKLAFQLEKTRRENPEILGPDGKTQVTIQDGEITTVLVSSQHQESFSQDELKNLITEKVINPIVQGDFQILINPTGRFIVGGFQADTGLTGRKIMVDTYGGIVPHGGGCFSGKDATKVDRSAAYMCRFVAKNIVANNYAKQCLVSVAYAIGQAEPLMLEAINEKNESLASLVSSRFDFRPQEIIKKLDLRKPIYFKTAAYGHFGRNEFPWEEVVSL